MTILDVLKVVQTDQSVIVDVYVDGRLSYCSILDNAETAGEALSRVRAEVLGLNVTEIKTKEWKDPIKKKKIVSLYIASDN